MYSKQEKTKLVEAFWTAFGRYLSPHNGAGGDKVNWINYKTGVRHISFRMRVLDGTAGIAIELSHPDALERQQVWDQFIAVRHLLEAAVGASWDWEKSHTDEYGHQRAVIGTKLEGINLYDQEQWPALISFFKPRLLALDIFWEQVKHGFEM